ncbi:hypothetical protein AQ490_05655 [Wenjunlia vitaminophila]|uniref:Heparinase II/III-like protein n=1 Tax=Wenjunlia vitaminophila TaxID=76728 RepID=A0A0T6LP87_WENVI|nr:hypothetical protein [Wenjunlia vitaminophila]KRV47845.1 hypothetical protein AQ490_05655 [Wenjunlia vitaminophila]
MRDHDRALLLAGLAEGDRLWDPDENLLLIEAPYNPIHTSIKGGKAHPTRHSLHYALLLLERAAAADDGSGDLARACAVLERIAALQDRTPENDTYGIWGYYAEEPPWEMVPADWNWADFLGTALLLVDLRHGRRLPEPVRAEVRESLRHAAASIVRRDVSMTYTNIAVMGTFVTLVAGEHLDDAELAAYGRQRVLRLARAIDETGSFAEFNSPSYWGVVLESLTLLRQYARDPDSLRIVDRLHDRHWEHFLARWHPATRQLSGPMARCYSNDLGAPPHLVKAVGGLLPVQEKTRAEPNDITTSITSCVDYRAPHWALPRLEALAEPREHRELFSTHGPAPEVGTTWLDHVTTLGSVNHIDTWLQRRPLFGHWRRPDGTAGHIHWHLVKDDGAEDFDFASGVVTTVQSGPHAAWLVGFASPAGDRHHHLDMIRPGDRFPVRSLRVVVDVVGAHLPDGGADGVRDGHTVRLDLGTARLTLQSAVGGSFAGRPTAPPRVTPRDDGVRIETVLFETYQPTDLSWNDIADAYAGGTLSLEPAHPDLPDGPWAAPSLTPTGDGAARLEWTTPQGRALTVEGATGVVAREAHAARHATTLDGAPAPVVRLSRSLVAEGD